MGECAVLGCREAGATFTTRGAQLCRRHWNGWFVLAYVCRPPCGLERQFDDFVRLAAAELRNGAR